MKPAVPTRHQVVVETNRFLATTAFWAVVLLAIHLVPKGYAYRSSFRLACTIGFFTTAVMLCWQLVEPRERYLTHLYRWCFEDAPDPVERAWRRYLYSLRRACRAVATVLIVFLGSTALRVVDLWFPNFNPLAGLNRLVWWLAAFAIVLLPIAGSYLFVEAWHRRRRLAEQVELTSWYQPRKAKEIWQVASRRRVSDLIQSNHVGHFQTAGIQWEWSELTKNCIAFGVPGSGKTVCVLNAMLEGMFVALRKSDDLPTVLVIDPKGDYRGKLERLCERYGRSEDLLMIAPDELARSIRWNPLDSQDDEFELASRFTAIMEALGTKNSETSFWIDNARKFLRHSIYLLRRTNPSQTPPSFPQIARLLSSLDEIVDRTDRLDVRHPDTESCLEFFQEWFEMAEESRSGVLSHLTNMLDPFLMEPYKSVFSGRSTMRISDMVDQGRILYVAMQTADKEAMARVVGTFVKLEYFREVLKRPGKERPSLFLCDEFQVFFTDSQGKGDADFFERSRQSNHVNLIATQNLPALLKQAKNRATIDNLLGNCATKIFLRNGDRETNQYASTLIGQTIGSTASTNSSGQRTGIGMFSVTSPAVADSETDAYMDRVRAERFGELVVPSKPYGVDYAEAIVHHGARPVVEFQKTRWKVHPL